MTASAHAQPPRSASAVPTAISVGPTWRGDVLRADVAFDSALTPMVEHALHGGTTEVVLRAYVVPDGSDWPIALAAQVCRVSFAPATGIQVELATQEKSETLTMVHVAEVIDRCFRAHDLAIVQRRALTPRPYHVVFAFDLHQRALYDSALRWTGRGLSNGLQRDGVLLAPEWMLMSTARFSLASPETAIRARSGTFFP